MNQDPSLRELAQVIRDQEAEDRSRLDEQWDRLSGGQLSAEEETELRALAKSSTEARQAYEAFQPLGPEFQARVVQAIREQSLEQAAAPTAKPLTKLLPWRPRTVRWAGWSTAAAAAAASLMMLLRPLAPLPAYTLAEITGGSRALRGEGLEPMDFVPGDRFQMILRPDTEVTRAKSLKARAFLLHDRELRRLEVESHVEPNGMVKLEGSLDRNLQPGIWTLWAIVGRRGKLPDPEKLRSFSARAPIQRRDWVAVPQNIRIRAP